MRAQCEIGRFQSPTPRNMHFLKCLYRNVGGLYFFSRKASSLRFALQAFYASLNFTSCLLVFHVEIPSLLGLHSILKRARTLPSRFSSSQLSRKVCQKPVTHSLNTATGEQQTLQDSVPFPKQSYSRWAPFKNRPRGLGESVKRLQNLRYRTTQTFSFHSTLFLFRWDT